MTQQGAAEASRHGEGIQILGVSGELDLATVDKSLMVATPGWLAAFCAVCLLIPLAWVAALPFTAALCLIQPARLRRVASAWKGGKSNWRSEECSARAGQ